MNDTLTYEVLKQELECTVYYSTERPLFYPVDAIFAFNNEFIASFGNVSIKIPPNNKTNFGSIPWFFGWRFTGTKYPISYAVHDALVGEFGQKKIMVRYSDCSRVLTWKESKLVLKRLMQDEGASRRDVSEVKAGVGLWGKIKGLF